MAKKVYVAISGGVDSAVSAALLKQQGYAVYGVHILTTTDLNRGLPRNNSCSSESDLQSAGEVATHLKIPFEVWDFTKQYGEQVVDYLFSEYQAGHTPNPDVMCNKHIKFGLFYDEAIKRGADFVATGHYARVVPGSRLKENRKQSNFQFPTTNFHLLRGRDPNKDQSYFLWAIPREKLSKILFPVGGMHKLQVRALARQLGLPNADRKDSQGVCFIGKIDLPEFLKLRIPSRFGKVMTTTGQLIGEHQGAWYYTVGQRHGFGSAVGKPQYVVDKDVKTNQLVVAPATSEALYAKEGVIGQINWLLDPQQFSIFNFQFSIQVRYRQKPVGARVQRMTKGDKGRLRIRFNAPVFAVAPGQSMVLYKGAQVLGGGIIEKAN